MPNKYDNEIFRTRVTRDGIIMNEISFLFDIIRDIAQKNAMKVTDKAGDNSNYFSEKAGRAEKFAKDINEEIRPAYLTKDNLIKDLYAEEYRTSYFESLYKITNTGIAEGYLIELPRYTKEQFKKAINYPLSKLMNSDKMKTARNIDIEQLYTTVISGVESGMSLSNINKALDINLGYRDSARNWISKHIDRKGQQYRTMQTLRTEVLRMRSTAEIDQWQNQQPFVPSKLRLISVLDNRTRSQSANMDNKLSNDEGKFLYPNGNWYYPHQTGIAKYDINDRETTITEDPEFPPKSRIQRDPKTNKNKVLPFEDFKSYADKNNLKVNKYGEVLFK